MAALSADNLLKDAFQMPVIEAWAARLARAESEFDLRGFLSLVGDGWPGLTFGQRSSRIAGALDQYLTSDFPKAAQLLVACLDPPLGLEEMAPLERFLVWPQTTWTAQAARRTGDFDTAADTLREMTMRFSAEGELRVLFDLDEVRARETLRLWTWDPNPHVRRLVSEGTRPRLPLAARWRRFEADPQPVFELLDLLKDDPSAYVRRSVANNLNDWSKDHPDQTAGLLSRWAQGATPERRRLVHHGARTLVKRGHPLALGLVGADAGEPWRVEQLSIDPTSCRCGGVFRFSFRAVHEGAGPARAVVDFQLNPWPGSPRAKVFKGRTLDSTGGQAFMVEARRSLADTSGRRWRPGPHRLVVLVNGKVLADLRVDLVEAAVLRT